MLIDINTKRLYEKALNRWGRESQIGMLHEEIGELMEAINRQYRGRCGIGKIAVEIADVIIMLQQMMVMYDIEEIVEDWIRVKLTKLYKLVEN